MGSVFDSIVWRTQVLVVHCPLLDQISPAIPATCGVAIDVPVSIP
jgi:hypothetical protein